MFESRRPDQPAPATEIALVLARIFQPPKSAMQSGAQRRDAWVLQFEPASARHPDPLTGWTSTTDMDGEVRLGFATVEEAVAYCQRHGIAFQVSPPQARATVIKAYADNFAFTRKQPWSH